MCIRDRYGRLIFLNLADSHHSSTLLDSEDTKSLVLLAPLKDLRSDLSDDKTSFFSVPVVFLLKVLFLIIVIIGEILEKSKSILLSAL